MTIAPTARIDPRAWIGPGVSIGEYCVIEPDVAIGAGCRIEPYVYVKRWTTLGEANEISAGTALGTDPLDKNFTGERSYLRIGDGNKIREHYTISRGTAPESVTESGDDNYIMTSGHSAHNCHNGNRNGTRNAKRTKFVPEPRSAPLRSTRISPAGAAICASATATRSASTTRFRAARRRNR